MSGYKMDSTLSYCHCHVFLEVPIKFHLAEKVIEAGESIEKWLRRLLEIFGVEKHIATSTIVYRSKAAVTKTFLMT